MASGALEGCAAPEPSRPMDWLGRRESKHANIMSRIVERKNEVVKSIAGLIRRRIGASWKPLVLDAAPSSS